MQGLSANRGLASHRAGLSTSAGRGGSCTRVAPGGPFQTCLLTCSGVTASRAFQGCLHQAASVSGAPAAGD